MNTEYGAIACREVYILLNKLGLYKRIPKEISMYIEQKQNLEHSFEFDEKVPLIYQIENEETKNLIVFLFIKYINTSSDDADIIKNKTINIMRQNLNK